MCISERLANKWSILLKYEIYEHAFVRMVEN